MAKMFIPVILGTAREGRQSEKVAALVFKEAGRVFDTELVDVRDFRISATDNTQKSALAKKLSEKAERADGFIIVSPEYNFSYPGELKMMLDMLYQQYEKKPVGFCVVSAGNFGGVHALEQLKLLALAFKMVPVPSAVHFPNVHELFDAKGKVKDESYARRINDFLAEMAWYANALKAGREKNFAEVDKDGKICFAGSSLWV